MARKIADCRRWPSESNCSLTIIGDEEEVVNAAAEHAVSVHGHEDTPEFREQIRDFLEPEDSYVQGDREQEPMPG
jgi:predicted small metal-binding protein